MEDEFQKDVQNISAETIRKNMLWNVVGSVSFIAAQWMMTILIVHLSGFEEAGYLSLGLSLTNIFTNIAYFCIRNYQVSDVAEKYSADIYVTHRWVATGIAFVVYAVFVLINGYPGYVATFLLLFMIYRLNEPVVDVFHGIDQRAWRLDVAGKSFLMRGILTLAAFVGGLVVTNDLVITTLFMLLAAYGVIFLYDIPAAGRCQPFGIRFNKQSLLSLTRECAPLFVYAICLNAVVPIPRYFLEKIAGSEMLGYYGSVAIPASVIQLLASYIFTTFTALFSDYLIKQEKNKFLILFGKLSAAIGILIVAAMAGAALLGEWALVLLFTEKIRPYAYLLVPTIVCCGVIAFIWFFGMLLTVLRDMKGMLMGAVAGVITVAVASWPCIEKWGVDGVNAVLFISSIATLLIFVVRFFKYMKNWETD